MKKDRLQCYFIILIAIVTVSLVVVSDSIAMVNYVEVVVEYNISESSVQSERININTATLQELMTIGGIGEVIAQRIIDYRDEHGEFDYLEQLLEVEGIGDTKLQSLIDNCFV